LNNEWPLGDPPDGCPEVKESKKSWPVKGKESERKSVRGGGGARSSGSKLKKKSDPAQGVPTRRRREGYREKRGFGTLDISSVELRNQIKKGGRG